jgi:hypothetical protein
VAAGAVGDREGGESAVRGEFVGKGADASTRVVGERAAPRDQLRDVGERATGTQGNLQSMALSD